MSKIDCGDGYIAVKTLKPPTELYILNGRIVWYVNKVVTKSITK